MTHSIPFSSPSPSLPLSLSLPSPSPSPSHFSLNPSLCRPDFIQLEGKFFSVIFLSLFHWPPLVHSELTDPFLMGLGPDYYSEYNAS